MLLITFDKKDINDFLSINDEDYNGPHIHHIFVFLLMLVAILVGMYVMFKIPWKDITNGEEKNMECHSCLKGA